MSPHHPPSPDPAPPPTPPPASHRSPVPDQNIVVVANRQAAVQRKHQARRNLMIIFAGIAAAGAVFWYFETHSSAPLEQVASFERQVTSAVQQNISSFPAPGVTSTKASVAAIPVKQTTLDAAGVIADTNAARAANGGLPALNESQTLDDVAMLRLDDMFQKQYFAHVSPSGESATTVAASVGYDYLAIGENLAEGTFAGDQGLVNAWMNSPGHRANILNTHYTEIGVAVREGSYQGQTVWIAVQIFGKPTSACPAAPDPVLSQAINDAETALADMTTELEETKASIDAMQPQSGDAYNQKVAEYNALVSQYNTLAAQTKTEVGQYNDEVTAYNACL